MSASTLNTGHRINIAIHVAVAVIVNSDGQILISKRAADDHQGGLWEFPGGKLERGESAYQCLQRELQEELDIRVISAAPLIQINYSYDDRQVFLDVWKVDQFQGEAKGMEGQPVCWISADNLCCYDFPKADKSIIAAARLPRFYPILEDDNADLNRLKLKIERLITTEKTLIRLRGGKLGNRQYQALSADIFKLISRTNIELILNFGAENAINNPFAGVHLNSRQLKEAKGRPLSNDYWVAASCHNLDELLKAEEIGIDFAVLSPVLQTRTHPTAQPLGWEQFEQMVRHVNLPVYALGGLKPHHLEVAMSKGGQGIAGISMFDND